MDEQSEEVQRVGVVGMQGQDLPINGLGIRQPTRLMVLDRQRQGCL
jgi:hypothetical protein